MTYSNKSNLTNTDWDFLQKLYLEKSWAWWLNHIGKGKFISPYLMINLFKGTLIVFVIGFGGNILCLIVLCRRRKF